MAGRPRMWYRKGTREPFAKELNCMSDPILRVEDIQKYYGTKAA